MKRDGSTFLLEISEKLEEELRDHMGCGCDSWRGVCGYALESQLEVDLWVQLPSGFSFHFWRGDK